MIAPDQAQIMAALGVPTGPGVPLPAGAGSVFQSPAASWMDPQFPLVSGGSQFGNNTAAILQALGPMVPRKLGQGNFAPTRSGGSPV